MSPSRAARGRWFALVVLALAARTEAQPRSFDGAQERFRAGVARFAEGDHAAALSEFERSYALSNNANVLWNLSIAREALHRYVEALDDLRAYAARASGAARRRAEIDAGIARLEGLVGVLIVDCDAPGLVARINDVDHDASAVREGVRVSSGLVRVTLSAPGYERREFERAVAGRERVVLREPLVRLRSSIVVACDVSGAEVRVDGVAVARTPVAEALMVDEGRHRVELSREGYAPYATEVDVHGQGARVSAALPWLDPMPEHVAARLAVRANAPPVHITLDGRQVGVDGSVALPPGSHRLRVTRASFVPVELDVSLRRGERRVVDVWLDPTPEHRREWLDGVRRRRAIAWAFTGAGAAVLAAGAVGLGLSLSALADANDSVSAYNVAMARCATAGGPAYCFDNAFLADGTAREARAQDRLLEATASTVVLVAGAASLVAGLVLLARAGSASRFDRAAQIVVLPTPGGLGAAVRF